MKSFRAVVEDCYGCFEMWAKASISLSEKLFVLGSPVILILQHYNIFAFDIDMEICYWRKFEWFFLFKEGTPRCLLYSMKSHKRSVLDKDPECNSRCMIFHNVWYKFLIFETKRIILENLKKTKTTTKSSWKHLVLLCSCSQIGVFSQQVRKLTSGINCRWIFYVLK